MKYLFSLIIIFAIHVGLFAQTTYTIGGTVTDGTGAKIQAATVFIAGTEKQTMTDADGAFSFGGLSPGNYEVVVNMLGYNSVKRPVTIKDHLEILDLKITEKKIALNEVTIGARKQSPKDLKKFIRFFLGRMYDSEYCKILNPEIVNFGHTDTTLTATTDDFLLIENNYLGYRIKYLLKSFFCKSDGFHFFDGDFSFEPLTGTEQQQKFWDRNRRKAYEDSDLHFLRALYAGTTRKEGFLVYRSTTDQALILEPNPVDPQQFITHTDSSSVTVKISPMVMVVYDKQKAAQPDIISDKKPKKYTLLLGLPARFTLLRLAAKVDSRGSLIDRDIIFNYGYWGALGVANQLPFEYKPE